VGLALVVTLAATGTGGASPTAPAAPAQSATNLGAANAIAQTMKVNPRAGSLSLGIGFGVSLADYQNTVARAESRAIDLGIIGALAAAPGCDGGDPTLPAEDQPQPVRAEARGAPQSTGEVPEDKAAGLMTKSAEATPQPYSRAVTTTAEREVIAGVLKVGAGHSETITQFVDGTRESIARSYVSFIEFGGGAARLEGLTWEAVHRTGAVNESFGSFTIGGGTVHEVVLSGLLGPVLGPGSPVPLDPMLALRTVGDAIRPFGLNLAVPQSYSAGGFQFVDPLKVGFVPAEIRDSLVNAVFEGARPVREPLVDALFDADCSFETLVTVADIALGSFTGAGDFNLELGGVQATTRDFGATCFLCSTGGGLGPTIGPVNLGGGPSVLGGTAAPSFTPAAAPPAATPAANPTTTEREIAPASSVGKRGGALAAVSLVGIGLLAAVAEGDRRKMRKAQRLIPVEA
jgi:hypothetical protein